MIKKYYVGAKHIASAIKNGNNASCMHHDVDDAIAEATAQVQRGEVEIAVVVEVRYIIRRERPPVIVEPVERGQ